ncbi:MAG: hypothetical protein ACP6IP_05395 [Candidatus Njordarchaeia archaeon]
MAEERESIIKSIIVSLTTVIALTIIMYAIITWGGPVGLSTNELAGKITMVVLSGIHALFMIVFIGNLVEYFRRKPGVITMLTIIVIELLYLYSIGLASDRVLFSGSVAAVLLALVYSLLAS